MIFADQCVNEWAQNEPTIQCDRMDLRPIPEVVDNEYGPDGG